MRLSDAMNLRAQERAAFDAKYPDVAPAASVVPSDPRIGMLSGGRFYAYVDGHSNEPVVGSLAEVEAALLRSAGVM
jgi:hypothetical protein